MTRAQTWFEEGYGETQHVGIRGTPLVDALYQYLDLPPVFTSRSSGLHASALSGICPRKEALRKWFPKDEISEFSKPNERAEFALTVDFGTCVHNLLQDTYFARMQYLWGSWRCSRCRCVMDDQFAPRGPCECGWSWRGACRDSCIWPGGFEEAERDCQLCRRWGSWEYVEPVVANEEIGFVGRSDGLIMPPFLGGAMAVLEIKTKTKAGFDFLKKPEDDHEIQAKVYLHELRKRYSNVERAVVLYIHKGEYRGANRPKEFWLDPDPPLVGSVYGRVIEAARIAGSAECVGVNQDHPERACASPSCWRAKRCAWAAECYDSKVHERVQGIAKLRGGV